MKELVKRNTPNWLKDLAYQITLYARMKITPDRALPDLIIIGAQKSGTSSLYYYLKQHPEILAPLKKELHFFDGGLTPHKDDFNKGEAWYRSHFPRKGKLKRNNKTFEASPLYLFNPLTPQRIYDMIPTVKILVVLRNPVERAISHYFHAVKHGHEKLGIREALNIEESRLETPCKNANFKDKAFIQNSYKARGLYHEQLKRYFNIFPKESLLTLDSESLFSQPNETLSKIFDFMGVDDTFTVEDLKPRNIGSNRKNVDTDLYLDLENYFRPHNNKLFDLLGEAYDW